MPNDSQIEAAVAEDIVLLRIVGRGCFLNSRILKDFMENMLEKNYLQFIFDLSECLTMDSTFMGMLAGIAMKLHQKKEGTICLVNPNKQCYRLLSTLGLDQIMEIHSHFSNPSDISQDFKGIQSEKSYSKKEKLIHAIEAHKNLMKIDSQNKLKFENVINLLERDLEKYKSKNNENPDSQ